MGRCCPREPSINREQDQGTSRPWSGHLFRGWTDCEDEGSPLWGQDRPWREALAEGIRAQAHM